MRYIIPFLAGVLAVQSTASASLIVGGSDLLTQAYGDQLETWLGQGSITLTNIFDYKANGVVTDIATPFHAAADGQGPTFTLIRVVNVQDAFTGQISALNQIVGGYNPLAWNSSGTYSVINDDDDRTAFLFNLSTGLVQHERLTPTDGSSDYGPYATSSFSAYGPWFGYYGDLAISRYQGDPGNYLSNFAFAYNAIGAQTYESPSFQGTILGGAPNGYHFFSLSDIEVFALNPTVSTVPEPSSLLLCGCGILGAGFAARRRRNAGSPGIADAA